HPWSFYLLTVSPAIGLAVLGAAAVGMVALWRDRSWREALLGCWMVVPIVFFQLWPVKGFQYLLPVAAPLAVLAARALVFVPETRLTRARPGVARAITVAVTAVAALTLAVPTWARVDPAATGTFLAGSGGVPGGREAGAWIDANIPEGAELLAIGPSMANIVQFYGHRRAYGLSVSNNPLHRNPVYEPVPNPDLWLRHGVVQYMVWDSFTAARTPFFTDKLLQLTERYNGRIVHTESLTIGGVAKPVIVIYEVRP
ncbi:MAG: hypothetical protein OEY23_26085, partial [Acidimicrobiia bacterium]|nr:hypothetical protein [Acidimicrobiia bacterium]